MNKRYRRLSLAALSLGLGACDAVLSIPGRTSDTNVVCSDEGCQCAAGHGDCDGDDSNGCEADLDSVMSCGGCGNQCLNGSCMKGECACNAGFFDCDGMADNGCETDLSGAGNCGGCRNRCLNGICVDAACECKAGFSNCDGLDENGCETSINDDPDHCGACGHSCLGGACEAGRCRPVQIFEGSVGDLELIGDDFYFMSDYGLQKLPKGGAAQPTYICDAFSFFDYSFQISGGFAFWSYLYDALYSCPIDIEGGMSKEVVSSTSGGDFFYGFGAGGGWLYWSMFDPQNGMSGLFRARGDGTTATPELVASLPYESSVVADGARVYWTDGVDVNSITHDLASTEKRSLDPYLAKNILAIDARNLYVSSYDTSGAGAEVVQIVPLDGGDPTTLEGLFCGYNCLVSADAQHLYLANPSSGILRRAPLGASGGQSEILLFDEGFSGSRIILDDTSIYWATNRGIFRLAK